MKDLKGETAVVTGAARGIGRAVAEILARHGAFVYIADLREEDAERTAADLRRAGLPVSALCVDVGSPDSVRKMAERIVADRGRIDILVNNAGIFSGTPIPELSVEDWDRVVSVNLRGTHLCSQAVIGKMIPRRYGKIVNMSSMSFQTGGIKAGADYTASKGGVVALTRAYARYGAPCNITVNAVAPGFILTAMTESWAAKEDAGRDIPLGRVGSPEDVANVVYFLASPLSDYVTGQVVSVNGGIVMA